jgi:hypothetical protein
LIKPKKKKKEKYCTGGQPPQPGQRRERGAPSLWSKPEALKPGALCDVYTLVGVHVRIEQASSCSVRWW